MAGSLAPSKYRWIVTTRNGPPIAALPSAASAGAKRCSVLGALAVVGDFWALAVVRSVFNGFSRFADLQRELGIATNVLSDRLGRLVAAGVLQRVPYGRQAARHEYALTAAGRDLAPVLLALSSWGDRYVGTGGPRTVWRHAGCASPASVQVRCPDCGAAPELSEMEAVRAHERRENA